MMPGACDLYEQDFVLWSEEQASALRKAAESGTNLPLDWENLAEEIESLGRSLRSELRSRLATVVEHLLELEFSRAFEPRRGWIETILRERRELDELLEENPSLRPALPELLSRAHVKSWDLAALSLEAFGELPRTARSTMEKRRYSLDQVLGDWIPAAPSSA